MSTTAPIRRSILLAAVLLLAAGHALARPTLVGVHVLSRLADEPVATAAPVYARESRKAVLSVVALVRDGGTVRVLGDAPQVRLPGRKAAVAPERWPADLGPVRIRWLRVEPDVAGRSFDNTAPSYHYDEIPYAETAVLEGVGQWSLLADPRPTLLPAGGAWVGTMRYKVEVTALGATAASPGATSRLLGGLGEDVARVTYLGERDDPYVSTLLGFFNQPYIWGSMGSSDRRHQTELFIGADCADLLTGAYRLWSGRDVPYGWSGSYAPGGSYSKRWGRIVSRAAQRAPDGVFRDGAGRAVTVGPDGGVQVGDVLVLPRHVGVLSEDRAPRGVLDDNDLVIHTLFAEPREEPLLRRWHDLRAVFRWSTPR